MTTPRVRQRGSRRGGGFRESRAETTVCKSRLVRRFYVILSLPKFLKYPYEFHNLSSRPNLKVFQVWKDDVFLVFLFSPLGWTHRRHQMDRSDPRYIIEFSHSFAFSTLFSSKTSRTSAITKSPRMSLNP